MTYPLISIIIPVYNAERYLERCLHSVLSQDYEEVEIVLVNDGSTDSSLSICRVFQEQYPKKVRLISQENSGASLSRKRGIDESSGEYLMFVDSDDYVSPYYVSSLYAALCKANAQIAVCGYLRGKEGTECHWTNPQEYRILNQGELFDRFFKYEFWGFWGGCYHRSVFQEIIFPKATINEDYFVKAQMFSKHSCVGYVSEPLYFYEQHQGSLSHLKLSLRALEEFDNAYATWKYIRKEVPRYSNQALAIAFEVSCKWLSALGTNKKMSSKYVEYENNIRRFVRSNLFLMIGNKFLYWKVKITLLYVFIFK